MCTKDISLPAIFLSPPHINGTELERIHEVFRTNWIAPLGPHVKKFEEMFARLVGVRRAVAVSTGTAALHLALRILDVGPTDEVLCSSLTFIASANPIRYLGATPIFIDSEAGTWNMDPQLLAEELKSSAKEGKIPKAVIVVDIFGQSADYDPIQEICRRYGVPIIEDAAEALGATYRGKPVGQFGKLGVFSFNGNKIITTSGGGMLVSNDIDLTERALFLATQARDPQPHYEHSQIGFNYRLSNVLAAIGLAQLEVLRDRVEARRENFQYYQENLRDCPGISFMPEAHYGKSTRWLTCIMVESDKFGATREEIRVALERENIESRPVWKPMHLQPVFQECRVRGGAVSERIFKRGLCLPSGSNLTRIDLDRVIEVIRSLCRNKN